MLLYAWRRSVLAKKATLSGNAMIRLSLVGQQVQPLLYLRLYLAGEQLRKLSATTLLLKRVLQRLCILWIYGEIRRKMILSLANQGASNTAILQRPFVKLYPTEASFVKLFTSISLLTHVLEHESHFVWFWTGSLGDRLVITYRQNTVSQKLVENSERIHFFNEPFPKSVKNLSSYVEGKNCNLS